MSKNKFTDEFRKMLQDKNRKNLIVICLIAVFILIAFNVFQSTGSFNTLTSVSKNNENTEKTTEESNVVTEESYEEQQKTDLTNILKKMNGVGDVDVMITFENGEEKVPAYDNTKQKAVTEETDNAGGKRVNNQNTDNSKVVMKNSDGKNEPFILTTMKPKIVGIIIVAEGAENSKTKYEIEQAVSKLYNLSLDKINVLSMKK